MLNPPLGPPSLRPISVASFLMNEYHIKSALDARACGWGGGESTCSQRRGFFTSRHESKYFPMGRLQTFSKPDTL